MNREQIPHFWCGGVKKALRISPVVDRLCLQTHPRNRSPQIEPCCRLLAWTWICILSASRVQVCQVCPGIQGKGFLVATFRTAVASFHLLPLNQRHNFQLVSRMRWLLFSATELSSHVGKPLFRWHPRAPSHSAPSGTDSVPHLCHSGSQRHSGDTTPLQIASRHLTKKCPMIDLRMRRVTTSVVREKPGKRRVFWGSSSLLRMKKQTVWEHQPIFTGEKYPILSILFVGESPLWSWDNHCCWYIIIPHFCWLNPSKSSFGNSIPYKSESSRTWKTCLQKLLCRCPCIYIYYKHHRYTNTSRHYDLYCSMMNMIKQTQVHTL